MNVFVVMFSLDMATLEKKNQIRAVKCTNIKNI